VDKALAGAERQTLLMAEKYSAREGRLPRTWENGEDVSSDSRWWCSGFFPGVLWYVYENGRNPRVLEYARMFTARVEREKHTTDNHDVGFMLYCSFGNGLRLTGDKSYEEVLLTSPDDIVRTAKVTLYFPSTTGQLVGEERRLTVYEGESIAQAVVKALTEPPLDRYTDLREPLLPEGFSVLNANTENGTCYLNLPAGITSLLPAGARR